MLAKYKYTINTINQQFPPGGSVPLLLKCQNTLTQVENHLEHHIAEDRVPLPTSGWGPVVIYIYIYVHLSACFKRSKVQADIEAINYFVPMVKVNFTFL